MKDFVFESPIAKITEEIIVSRKKTIEGALLGECREIATENGLVTQYLIDDTFVINALKRAADNKAHWEGKRGDYKCSRCRAEAPNDGYYPAPYCYECGAEMDRINEESEAE